MFEAVPQELKARPQWVLWRRQERAGKATKVPHQANGALAAVDRPETWTTFESALAAYANGSGFDGLGFVLTSGDPYVGVDLDGDPFESVEALQTMFRLSSYMERSPSGRGVHIWVKGALPADPNPRRRRGRIEVYDSGRYLTVTGQQVGSHPAIEERTEQLASVYEDFLRVRRRGAEMQESADLDERAGAEEGTVSAERAVHRESADASEPAVLSESTAWKERAGTSESTGGAERTAAGMSDQELLGRMFAASNGPALEALHHGVWAPKYASQSEADMALAGHLLWWCDGDLARADRLFRASGLMREKWDERRGGQTYGEQTFARVVERMAHRGYQPRQRQLALAPALTPTDTRSIDIDGGKELMGRAFPELVWRVHELLPEEGLCLLVGRPKIGKSWLALQLAVAISNGETFLERATSRTGVLLLALEDSPRRLQRRLLHLVTDEGVSEGFKYAVDWLPLSGGGEGLLDEFLTRCPEVGVVIVDTFAAISGPAPKNANAYEYDYLRARALAKVGLKHRCLMVVLHHDRKADSEDWLLTVSGTQGLTGGADAVLLLRRARGAANGYLHVTGRDLIEQKLALSFADARWTLIAVDADQLEMSSRRKAVLDFMREIDKPMSAGQIAEGIEGNREAAKKLLRRMARDGLVRLTDAGWSLPAGGDDVGTGDAGDGDIEEASDGTARARPHAVDNIPAWLRGLDPESRVPTYPTSPQSPSCPGCGLDAGHAAVGETFVGSGIPTWTCPRCGHAWLAEAASSESAVANERAGTTESTRSTERAAPSKSTGGAERADVEASTDAKERPAVGPESAAPSERVEEQESADFAERAGKAESADPPERADPYEGAVAPERAIHRESTASSERAATGQSAEDHERAAAPEGADLLERAESGESTEPPPDPDSSAFQRMVRGEPLSCPTCRWTGTMDHPDHPGWRWCFRCHAWWAKPR